MKKNVAIPLTLLLVVFSGLYVVSHGYVDAYRAQNAERQRIAAAPFPPEILSALAGEFKGVAADYLLLEASAFIGGRNAPTAQDWEQLGLMFEQIIALDPYFRQSYILLQSTLPWDAKKYDLTIALLEKSQAHRPWDWLPGFFIGFDYFYFLKDNLTASKYLMEAARIPGAPLTVATLGARLGQKAGQTETSLEFLKAMFAGTDDEEIKQELQLRIEALAGVLVLEKGIAQFSERFGRRPAALDELLTAGILREIPPNPYHVPYVYAEGKVNF